MYNYFYSCPRTGPDLGPLHPIAKVPTQQVKCGGDSGVRFIEFWGQVLVIPCFDRDEEDVADYDYVVKWWDTIETSGNSGAILGFGDMSTFTMKAHTSVIIDKPEEKGRWTLKFGEIKANVKQMIEEGTLDVTMNQAVSGTKTTIFVAEDTGETSTLKVIEGEMWFQSLATGEMVDVVAGQMVSADANGLSPITSFDIQAELATWPDDQNPDWSAIPEISQTTWLDRLLPDFLKSPPLWVGILVLLFGLAGLGLFAFLVFIRAITKKEAAKPSTKTMRLVLLAGLLSVSCLVSLCGVGGLYLNLSQPKTGSDQTVPEPPQAALAQTEIALGLQQTQMAQPLDQPVADDEPVEVSTPTLSAPEEPVDAPEPTAQVSAPDKSLTGAQVLSEHSFIDDFSSNALGWPIINDSTLITKVDQGVLTIRVIEKVVNHFVFIPTPFNPYLINFDITSPTNYGDGTFGLVCQYQDAENHYYLEFDPEFGSYSIMQVRDGENIVMLDEENQKIFWKDMPAFIAQPGAVNNLSVNCSPDGVTLFANDQLIVDTIADQPFNQEGLAGILIYAYSFAADEGYQIILDNVEAFRPVQ